MTIKLEQVSKKFGRNQVLRDLSYTFQWNQIYAVTGKNGAGKSTLLQIIAGIISQTTGRIEWALEGKNIAKDNWYRYTSMCSPSMEIITEMTLEEFLEFHFIHKSVRGVEWPMELIELMEMGEHRHKRISEFSSGMQQRVKLVQALFSDTPVLLLDEPTSYLDEYWVKKYQAWVQEQLYDRCCIIASNDPREYSMAHHRIELK